MMKKLLLLLPILVLSFSFSVNATDKVDIRLNLKPDHSYSINTNLNSTTRVNTEELNMEINTNQKVDIEYIVKSKSNEGYLLEGFYREFENETIFGERRSAQTTNSDKVGKDGWSYQELLASLIDKPFLIEITDKGEGLSIDGLDAIMDELRQAIIVRFNKMLSSEQIDNIFEVFNSGHGKNMINDSFSFLNTIIPPKPTSIGDKWSVELDNNAWGMSGVVGVCEYKGIFDGSHRIDGEYYLDFESEKLKDYFKKAFSATMPGEEIEMKFDYANINISILLNSTTGWIDEITTKYEVKCNMSFDHEGEQMELPIELDVHVVVKG